MRKRNKINQENEANKGIKTLDPSDLKQEDHENKSKLKINEENHSRKIKEKKSLMKEEEKDKENEIAKKRLAHHEIEFTSFGKRESITLQILRQKLREINPDEGPLYKTVKKMITVLQKIKNTRNDELNTLKFGTEL